MNISGPFIARPVATTLLTIGIALAGILAFARLAVSPLPQVDFPTMSVTAVLPGASPETVATSVAAPLERRLGQIADVDEMTSSSGVGQARINIQFGLDRDINGAARDVQAAINAARADLPTSLRTNPTYHKVNPADSPILVIALTSTTRPRSEIYDEASNIMQQRLSQIDGVGEVVVGGGALPAVRVELNPTALFKYGIGLEDVRAALASANANSPKGAIEVNDKHYQIYTNDQANVANDYKSLIVAYRNGNAVRLTDLAEVEDSVEDLRNDGMAGSQPSILVIIFRQPGANILDTLDKITAELPQMRAELPSDVDVVLAGDRSRTIRASLHDTETTLVIAVLLVTFIVFLFLGDVRAALVPGVAVPVSIIGTFGAMYLLDFSLNNLSLMALTIATGFVVDDAIVVLENITRYIEAGVPRVEAALRGTKEVGFTVLSISISLITVFTPILLMGGVLGRLFREFAVTLALAIAVSLVVSLTTTPMMCALFLRPKPHRKRKRRSPFDLVLLGYERSLAVALRFSPVVMLILIATMGLTVYLYVIIPKGFFPQQDIGRLVGVLQGDQSVSFSTMQAKFKQGIEIVAKDKSVEYVVGFLGSGGSQGGGGANVAQYFVSMKPLSERSDTADQIVARLRKATSVITGARVIFQASQDIKVGSRNSSGQYQYTLQADSSEDLYNWSPKLVEELIRGRVLADVNSDQQQLGLSTNVTIDRDMAARLGVTPAQIDNTLYDAFGQRQVSTIYSSVNQYHVVMEVAPQYWARPETLNEIYVSTSGGGASGSATSALPPGSVTKVTSPGRSTGGSSTSISDAAARNAATNAIASGHSSASTGSAVSTAQETMVPLSAFAHFSTGNTALSVSHQGPFVASTISFNLKLGTSLSDAATEIQRAVREIGMPAAIHGSLQGTAKVFQTSLANEPFLIAVALAAVYIVLGILYESYVHPITILSTLPSAGVGALLALMAFKIEFSLIALIGVILLIGIVKKNAIMMVDFAVEARRTLGMSARDAIFQACILRFRPIMMTTAAAILGAVPLALSFGDGGEIRRPLGIAIVGGLLVSQLLTLYTTPVLYLALDYLSSLGRRKRLSPPTQATPEAV